MPLAAWQATIVDESGNVQAGASIEVRSESTGALAAIYADRDGNTPLSNPFNADEDGFARFHVSGGAFRITATKGSFSRTWRYVGIGLASEYDDLPSERIRYERTPAEIAAGVTPTNYAARPLRTARQETDRYASIADALSVLETGDVTEPIYYLEDWGAPCNGVDDDAPALQALIDALYAIDIHETSAGRRAMPTIQLPARALRFKTNVDLGKDLGTMGLTIRGCGAWATTIYVDAGVTITGKGASNLSWEHLAFRSDAIDDDVTLFTISTADGGVLRRWTFNHVDFFGIYECFNVTGDTLCDEFKFIGCHFLECYRLVNNDNNQAVNWNFWACDYEATLEDNTSKDPDDACMFSFKKGMAVNWYGGSIIIHGQMVLMDTSTINSFNINAHFVNFDGVRMELMDNAGTHAPLVKRSNAYVNGNSMKFTLQNFTMINRGTLPSTIDLFELCNNWILTFRNGEIEGGYVTGILDENTSTQNGVLIVDNVRGLLYREDTTTRLLSHHQHNVTLIHPNLSDEKIVPRVQRSGGTSGVSFTQPQRLYVTGNTGSLPAGGTTVNLPDFYNHARLCELVLQQYETTSADLTVQLRDQADTTTYATVTLPAGSGPREARAPIAREIGFQIGTEGSPVPLMLKFIGTPEIQKGVVWIEYM